MADLNSLLLAAVEASLEAGKEIMDVYKSDDLGVEIKEDNSPLTLADKRGNDKIMEILESTNLPTLSEEGKSIAYDERKDWEMFWMIDPLDGTKEFVKRNGEFTVNIALIKANTPVMGVIYVPVKEELYFSSEEIGAYKLDDITSLGDLSIDDLISKSDKLPKGNGSTKFTVVGSRSHKSVETEECINQLSEKHGDIEMLSIGSSLKLCMVAEGRANVYPRYAPTMEWDTAAGHAIALGADKNVIDYSTNEPMLYNKENLLNNWFTVQ
ncbi:MAG: 3'(2'),5'-bisphosphate nucleotidase CysQ [Flavobacteriales bacterium]|nr:3'(2'),5'-bisphosphate nucleotidase CysQ [Flavobacteriales bacterium]